MVSKQALPDEQLDWRWAGRYRELVQYDANQWLTAAAFSPADWETWTQGHQHSANEESQQRLDALMTQSREHEILAALSGGREPHLHYPRIPIAEVRQRIEGLRSLAVEVAHNEPNT